MVELRLGTFITLVNMDAGELNLVFRGGFMINGLYTNDAAILNSPLVFGGKNPNIISVGAGINFMFDLVAL